MTKPMKRKRPAQEEIQSRVERAGHMLADWATVTFS
jgi:hypothetical protein